MIIVILILTLLTYFLVGYAILRNHKRKLGMSIDQFDEHIRDLRKRTSKCSCCDGTGIITHSTWYDPETPPPVVPCPECSPEPKKQ